MSDAIHAKGTLIQRGDSGNPETFTTIAEVRSIDGPNFTGDVIDVTTHSTAGNFREFKSNIIDPGELAFEINFLPTNSTHSATTGLLADIAARAERNYRLVFPGGSPTWTVKCQVVGFSMRAPVDNILTAGIRLKITNPPTLA